MFLAVVAAAGLIIAARWILHFAYSQTSAKPPKTTVNVPSTHLIELDVGDSELHQLNRNLQDGFDFERSLLCLTGVYFEPECSSRQFTDVFLSTNWLADCKIEHFVGGATGQGAMAACPVGYLFSDPIVWIDLKVAPVRLWFCFDRALNADQARDFFKGELQTAAVLRKLAVEIRTGKTLLVTKRKMSPLPRPKGKRGRVTLPKTNVDQAEMRKRLSVIWEPNSPPRESARIFDDWQLVQFGTVKQVSDLSLPKQECPFGGDQKKVLVAWSRPWQKSDRLWVAFHGGDLPSKKTFHMFTIALGPHTLTPKERTSLRKTRLAACALQSPDGRTLIVYCQSALYNSLGPKAYERAQRKDDRRVRVTTARGGYGSMPTICGRAN